MGVMPSPWLKVIVMILDHPSGTYIKYVATPGSNAPRLWALGMQNMGQPDLLSTDPNSGGLLSVDTAKAAMSYRRSKQEGPFLAQEQ